jgi:hypothetical protein
VRGFATGSFTVLYDVETDDYGDPSDDTAVRGVGVALSLRRAGMADSSQASGVPRNIESYRGRAPTNAPLYQDDLKTGSLRLYNPATDATYVITSIGTPTNTLGHSSLPFEAHRVL